MARVTENITLEGAHIRFTNFAGREDQYTREGDRNFAVDIADPDLAEQLAKDGWNVRYTKTPEDRPDIEPVAYMPVAIKFEPIAPKIYKVTETEDGHHGQPVLLDEEAVGGLDSDDIKYVDIVIRPYNWEVSGKKGVKAYVKEMFVVVADDYFGSKWFGTDDVEPF